MWPLSLKFGLVLARGKYGNLESSQDVVVGVFTSENNLVSCDVVLLDLIDDSSVNRCEPEPKSSVVGASLAATGHHHKLDQLQDSGDLFLLSGKANPHPL